MTSLARACRPFVIRNSFIDAAVNYFEYAGSEQTVIVLLTIADARCAESPYTLQGSFDKFGKKSK